MSYVSPPLSIFRKGSDVTRFGQIRQDDEVAGPWQGCISRQIVAGRPLEADERVVLRLYGRTYDSAEISRPWRLWSADRFGRKRPVSQDRFESDYELVGKHGKLTCYRKKTPRLALRYSRALAPMLSLETGNETRPLNDGDLLFRTAHGRYGIWPGEWANRFVQPLRGPKAPISLAEQIDQPGSLFDQHARPCVGLRILRRGEDVTAAGEIRPGDTVECSWRATKSNEELVTVQALQDGEFVAGRTPWDALLESDRRGWSYELYPLSDPTDWRIISAQDLDSRYLYVGQWGEHPVFRQKVGTLAFTLTDRHPPLKVWSKESTREPHVLTAGWCLVYDGNGGFYHWSPEAAAKRTWL